MTRHLRTTATAFFILSAMLILRAASAQDKSPAAKAPAKAAAAPVADAAAKPAPKATAKAAAVDPPDDGKSTPGMPVIVKHDPVIDTIVDSNPQTPRQLLHAASVLADLDHPELAKPYLQRILGAKLSDDDLAELASHADADALMRMSTNKALAPEGQQVADAVFAVAGKLARDPKRIAAAIDQLSDPSPAVQQHAVATILAAHEDAVPSIVLALADANRSAIHPVLQQTLVYLGSAAVPPLVAALQSNNAALKLQVIDVLSQISSREAVPFLAAPATAESSPPEVREAARAALLEIQNVTRPSLESAVKLLTAEIQRHLKHEKLLKPDADNNVDVWRWDAAAGVPVHEKLPAEQADAAMAKRLADDLILLVPDDPEAKRLFLISTLESAADRTGPDKPLPQGPGTDFDQAAKLGAPAIENALTFAITTGHIPAAIAAAQVLGAIGDRSLLEAKNGEPRPLVQALSQRDRRLRFAAAEAIVKIAPSSGFAGSSDLMSALAYFASSSGTKRALVAFPNDAVATQLAAMLATQGFEADSVGTGRPAFLHAMASPDYELVLVSSHIDRPPVWVVLAQLRHDPRTAKLPVILMAEDDHADLERLQSIAMDDSLTAVFERPSNLEGMKFFLDRLSQQIAGRSVPMEVRQQQAVDALAWLKQLNQASPRQYDLQPYETEIVKALHTPKLSAAAAELLATIGSHTAQRALIEVANRVANPLDMRQSAAAAFSQSVRKHGIQLTSLEIQHQYDRYNLSAQEDAATQQLLALILDAIELPTSISRISLPPAPRPSSLVPQP